MQSESRGRALNPRHGRRAGERRRVGNRQSGQRGLAETLHCSGDAAAEVPAPGGENPRAAGREGKREKSVCILQVFLILFYWKQLHKLFKLSAVYAQVFTTHNSFTAHFRVPT